MKAVIFDLNGTMIYDSAKHEFAWKKCIFESFGIKLSEDEFNKNINGKTNRKIVEYVTSVANIEFSEELLVKTADEKEQLDIASIKLMLKAAELSLSGNKNVIIESNFMTRDKKYLKEFEEKTGETITTLRMDCDMDVLYDRALARDGSSSRHPAHSVADHYPAPEGEELVYSPLWTKEEYKYNVKISGVQDFSYGTTFTIDTTDFIKIRLDEVAMELDKLFLE